ncbi:MAG TPA: GTP cyclohydrolase FolE2 [Nitrosospira sp.]|jgi:GTP cyclohydrolase I|nr:GTP cyclohydrolase FolE2 [Nitrosospira sp.]
MNEIRVPITDVQNLLDTRRIAVNKAGIRAIRHPVKITDRAGVIQHTVATFNMYVNLPHDIKGVHMSRFVEVLNEHESAISVESFENLLRVMIKRLDADSGDIEMVFPYFLGKTAPISGIKSLLDYEVAFIGEIRNGHYRLSMKVIVPVTSLCPCSKQVAEYGAHNQRSHMSISIRTNRVVWIEDLIHMAEEQASCELYGLLKRSDEKYVTEKAYDNPKFVEDAVRDLAAVLNQDTRIDAYIVESENFESIHNHSAYAMIEYDKLKS